MPLLFSTDLFYVFMVFLADLTVCCFSYCWRPNDCLLVSTSLQILWIAVSLTTISHLLYNYNLWKMALNRITYAGKFQHVQYNNFVVRSKWSIEKKTYKMNTFVVHSTSLKFNVLHVIKMINSISINQLYFQIIVYFFFVKYSSTCSWYLPMHL